MGERGMKMLVFVLGVMWGGMMGAQANPVERANGLIIRASVNAPKAAAAAFTEAVTAKGAAVVATVDHAAAARKAGLALDDAVLVVFGNPKIGTPLMALAPTIAADLPLRALFWTEGGAHRAAVLDPRALAERHGIDSQAPTIVKLEEALLRFLAAAAE